MNPISLAILLVVCLFVLFIAFSMLKKALSGTSCCGTTREKSKRKKLKHVEGQLLFEVMNMRCHHCKSRIENTINAMEGYSARVNLEKKQLVVAYDNQVDKTVLIKAVEALGYQLIELF